MTPSPLSGARTVAVLRALGGLGDVLCAVPALRALRRGLPEAHVTLIGLPEVDDVVARFGSYVDELVLFPGFPGVPEVPLDPARTAAFLSEATRRRFDAAIQMHGSGRTTNAFVALLGARRTAGFCLPGQVLPDATLFLPYPVGEPEPLRHLALMRFLGLPADDARLELPVTGADREEAARLLRRHGVGGPYACVNAGASEAPRRWPAERFAAVADGLAARGLQPVLLGAPVDAPLAAAVARAMAAGAVDLAGQTSLGALGAVVAGAAVTVTNDTGTSHVAAALRAPSVVVFTASDPRRWAPLDAARHRALGTVDGPAPDEVCARCLRDGCRWLGGPRLTEVEPAEVLAAVDELLAASASRPSTPQGEEGCPAVDTRRWPAASRDKDFIMTLEDPDPRPDVEREDDERGRHNRLGYLNVDESDASSERGAEEPDVAEDLREPRRGEAGDVADDLRERRGG